MRTAFNVPRNTFTYLVEGYFGSGLSSLRNQVISRYSKFYQKLANSSSKEVRILIQVVKHDPRSTTCRNLRLLRKLSGFSQAEYYSTYRIKAALPIKEVPKKECWRLGLLTNLLLLRSERFNSCLDAQRIDAMIVSLCST